MSLRSGLLPREHDIKAPDGFLLGGWRLVRKGGYVRFAGARWTHAAMQQHIGRYCFIHVDDYMGLTASFTFDETQQWRSPWNGRQQKNGRIPAVNMDEGGGV